MDLIDGPATDVRTPQETQTRQLFSSWTRHIAFLVLFSNCEDVGGWRVVWEQDWNEEKKRESGTKQMLLDGPEKCSYCTRWAIIHPQCITMLLTNQWLCWPWRCYSKHKALRQLPACCGDCSKGALRARVLIARRRVWAEPCVYISVDRTRSCFACLCFCCAYVQVWMWKFNVGEQKVLMKALECWRKFPNSKSKKIYIFLLFCSCSGVNNINNTTVLFSKSSCKCRNSCFLICLIALPLTFVRGSREWSGT